MKQFCCSAQCPVTGLNNAEIITIRQTCLVAEAVYAEILSVYSDNVKDPALFGSLYGDSREVFSWHRACSHFCLLEGVPGLKAIAVNEQPTRYYYSRHSVYFSSIATEYLSYISNNLNRYTTITTISIKRTRSWID